MIDRGRKQEEQRDGKAVRHHHQHDAADAERRAGRDAEERVAHVHHGAVTDHLLEVALRDRNEADDQDVADDREPCERAGPVQETGGQQRKRDLDQAVETELLEHARVQHRVRTRRCAVAERRPGVKGPQRNEDAEAEHQQREDIVLQRVGDWLRCDRGAQRDEVEGRGAALHVERDQAGERKHRAEREVNGHLHRRVGAIASAPDADHDERRDQREFVEEIEEEDIDAGEHAHQPALHDEQQHQVNLEALGLGLDRIEAGGETDEAGEDKKRERDAVEAELQADAVGFEAGGVGLEEGVSAFLSRGGEMPPDMEREQRGDRERDVGQPDRPAFRQAERDGEGQRERRRDRDEERIEGQIAHRENQADRNGRKEAQEGAKKRF